MAKSGGEVPYSDELAKFLKMYIPQICSEKMIIPPEFIKNHPKIPIIVTLIGSNGDSWQVDVNRINGNRYFQKGWPEFVQENSLEYGDFMEFYYDGKSMFFVKVTARNGCPKSELIQKSDQDEAFVEVFATKGCPRSDVIGKSVQKNEASKPESSNRSQTAQRKSKPRMCSMETKSPLFASNGGPESIVIENDIQEDEASKRENSNHSQTSQRNLGPTMSSMARTYAAYPSFKVVMTEPYIRRQDMHLPQWFSSLYIGKSRCSGGTVTLRIKHDSWLVGLFTSSYKKVSFTSGWPKFKKDNSLKKGNKCTFELIDENALVFEVDIRR